MSRAKTLQNIGDVGQLRKEDGTRGYPSTTGDLLEVKETRVCVLNMEGKPLMPSFPRKARKLLREGNAYVVKAKPFTIRLKRATGETVQPITMGLDSGYETAGFSTITEKAEFLAGELLLPKDQSARIEECRKYQSQRRSRLRFRDPRFDNRRRPEGWLAPSIQNKLDAQLGLVDKIRRILPVSSVIVEVAAFDIQKIKDPEIEGKQYQQGEQAGYWNLREYILHRDGHKCQNPNCRNKAHEKVLQVHHIGYWKEDRSDRPANLITLCDKCHKPENHKDKGFLYGWTPAVKSFRQKTFMTIVRWMLLDRLRAKGFETSLTFGHVTKSKRIELDIPKSHANDAFVIAGGEAQMRTAQITFKQSRRNNRSFCKFYDAQYIDIRTGEKASGSELNCGRRTRNKNLNGENLRQYRGEKLSKGHLRIKKQRYTYQPNDIVILDGEKHTVAGMQNLGAYIKLRTLPKPVRADLVAPYRFMGGIE